MSRPPDPPAVVFDCMIFLQAIANDESAAARALDLVERSSCALVSKSGERFAAFLIVLKFGQDFPELMTFASNHCFVAWKRRR